MTDNAVTDNAGTTAGRGNLVRAVVLGAAVVATLLLGAAVGLLIQLPNSDDTSVPSADSVDVGFCQDMSTHHLQAVQMANLARDQSTDEEVRLFAFDITGTQLEQVGRMKGWLMLWGMPEQAQPGRHMEWMASGSEHGHSATGDTAGSAVMPGMATSEELTKLRSLSGAEFDTYFLQLMLRHHQGGAPMAEYGAEHAGRHAVRTLAESMLKSQTSESDYMEKLLADRGAAPLPL
ncbi:DUF305 domain-containing protein [Saccharothrix isguenensis]